MIRRLLVPLIGSGVLLAVTAGGAFAKCEGASPLPSFCSEIRVELNTSGGTGTYVAGRPTSFDIFKAGISTPFDAWVALGDNPYEATSVVLTFIRSDGTQLRVPTTATSQPGRWSAEVSLPAAGSWSAFAQVVDPTGTTHRVEMTPVHVGKPALAPPVTTPAAPASPLVPGIAILLALMGVAAAVLRRRLIRDGSRRPAPEPVAAASAPAADRP